MRCDRFRSKGMVYFMIGAFLFLIMAETVPARESNTGGEDKGPVVRVKENGSTSSAQQEQFDSLMADGKKLYDDMENESALQKFLQARTLAVTKQQRSDVYFYLSLVYFTLLEEGRSNEFSNAVNMLIEVDYYRQPDPLLCPQRYIEMYHELKKNYGILRVRSNPAGADVFLNNSRSSSGKTPLTIASLAGKVSLEVKKGKKKAGDTLVVKAGEETQSPEYKLKGKSSLLYVVGGLLLAGGVGAAVLMGGGSSDSNQNTHQDPIGPTTGSIQVNSNPSGAAIYLNGNDTGNVTPHTLQNVSSGSHEVMLVKEGYLNFEEQLTVTAGQTAVVSPELQRHVITFVAPDAGTTWLAGSTVEIVWEMSDTGGIAAGSVSALSGNSIFPVGNVQTPVFSGDSTQTRVSMPRPADTDQILKPSTSRSSVASRTSLMRTRTAGPARRRHASTASRSPFPSQGMDSPMMRAQGAPAVQILSAVKIDLYRGGALIMTITASTENDGLAGWRIPYTLDNGSNYRIRVSVAADLDIFFNSAKFSIVNSALMIVTDKSEFGVLEGQETTVRVKLSHKPSNSVNVKVKKVSGDKNIWITSGWNLTFTKNDWNSYQKVKVYARPDGDIENGRPLLL
ncbi:PEGA domain-containing protein [Acidobacteriota bacterium]